ncbi:MAG: hypothetical protein Ct9H300mP21_05380 [Pseudomonadota bacterium]|nr:MAG: hypothetical protein Ct9H300mP21_05380 [Pseudomonadota bacterium]
MELMGLSQKKSGCLSMTPGILNSILSQIRYLGEMHSEVLVIMDKEIKFPKKPVKNAAGYWNVHNSGGPVK